MTVAGGWSTAFVRALPPLLVGALLTQRGHQAAGRLALVVGTALLVVGLTAPKRASRWDVAVRRAAAGLASLVSRGLAVAGWTLLVLPSWALSQLGGRLRRRAAPDPTTSWTVLPPAGARSPDGAARGVGRAGSLDAPTAPRSGLLRFASVVVVVGLLTAGLVTVGRLLGLDAALEEGSGGASNSSGVAIGWEAPIASPYGHEDEPWAGVHLAEMTQVGIAHDAFLGYRLTSFEGRTINVVDGHRVSYTPEDPELTVWFFGGSTMFGMGQRDEHTLPSVVARSAEAEGIRIQAVNFGVSSYVNWQSLEQFEQALSTGEHPDLAVFYEGANDSSLGWDRIELGDLRPASISRLPLSDEERDRVRTSPDTTDTLPDVDRWMHIGIALAADQYRRGSQLIDALARSYGVRVVHLWQPTPFTKEPKPSDAPLWELLGIDPASVPDTGRQHRKVLASSGIDAVDLTEALDEIEEPVFFDGVHTNELGARVIGEAMYRSLGPELARAQARG